MIDIFAIINRLENNFTWLWNVFYFLFRFCDNQAIRPKVSIFNEIFKRCYAKTVNVEDNKHRN